MRRFTIWMALALPVVAVAQTLGAGSGTNKVYTSNVATNRAWTRHVVTATGADFGTLRDKSRVFASAAEIAAENEVAEHVLEVEEAWSNGFARGYAELRSKLEGAPTNGVTLGLQFPLVPSAARRAIEIYVPETIYFPDENCDYLYVFFSQALSIKPKMEMAYVSNGGFTTNRVAGTWDVDLYGIHWSWTEPINYVRQGVPVYAACHILRVQRPAELRDAVCSLNPHGLFGKAGEGVAWGNIVLTVDGRPTYSGTLTNTAERTYMTINNGAILAPGIQELTNAEAE